MFKKVVETIPALDLISRIDVVKDMPSILLIGRKCGDWYILKRDFSDRNNGNAHKWYKLFGITHWGDQGKDESLVAYIGRMDEVYSVSNMIELKDLISHIIANK